MNIKYYSSGLIFHLFFTVMGVAINMNDTIRKDDKTPIVVVIPGLTSDSASAVSFLFCLSFFHSFYVSIVISRPISSRTTLVSLGVLKFTKDHVKTLTDYAKN